MDDDSNIYLIGKTRGHLESSLFYEHLKIFGENHQRLISKKKKKWNFVKFLAQKTELLIGCHDISEGGIALALAELCIANKKGIEITLKKKKS